MDATFFRDVTLHGEHSARTGVSDFLSARVKPFVP